MKKDRAMEIHNRETTINLEAHETYAGAHGDGGSPLPGVFIVTQYGAKGDGVTDDIAAFNSAIADAAVAGGMVLVPGGVYLLSTKLDISSNLFTICGIGESSILRFTGATDGLFFQHTTPLLWGPRISNLRIETNNASGGAAIFLDQAAVFPDFLGAIQGAIIENVQIRVDGSGAWQYGLRTIFALECVARSLHLYNVGTIAGVSLEGESNAASNSWHFEDLRVRGAHGIGLWNRGSTALSFIGGTMEGQPTECNIRFQRMPGLVATPGGIIAGVHLENETAVPCIDIDWAWGLKITGCRLDTGSGAECIVISNSAPAFFISTATGGSSTTVVDTNVNFETNGVAVGDIIWNTTDNSRGIVTTVAPTTLTCSEGFAGGANDDFEAGDSYRLNSDQTASVTIENNLFSIGGIEVHERAYNTKIANNSMFNVTITDNGVQTNMFGNTFDSVAGLNIGGTLAGRFEVAGVSLAEVILHNQTREDVDGGRESGLRFLGDQSGGQVNTLALIEASHKGAADDQTGEIKTYVNDGNDGDSPTLIQTIDSAGVTVVGTVASTNVNTGQGANELYAMDQNVQISDSVIFDNVRAFDGIWHPAYRDDTDLVLDMPLTEGAGTITYDRSGQNNDGTITDAAWSTSDYGTALLFDGTGDFVTIPDDAVFAFGTAVFSVELSIYTDPGHTNGVVLGQKETLGRWQVYVTTGGDLVFYADGSLYTFDIDMTDNQWYHIAIVRSGDDLLGYVDGELVDTDTDFFVGLDLDNSPNTDLFIGQNSVNQMYTGRVSQVRIYTKTLAPEEVRAHYTRSVQAVGTRYGDFRVIGDLTIADTDPADNTVLQTDSNGYLTVTPSGGIITLSGQSAVSVYAGSNQNITPGAFPETLELDTEVYDVRSEWNTGTYTFTATVAGKYHVTAAAKFSVDSDGDLLELYIMKNGSPVARTTFIANTTNSQTVHVSKTLVLAATNTIYFIVYNATNNDTILSDVDQTFCTIEKIH